VAQKLFGRHKLIPLHFVFLIELRNFGRQLSTSVHPTHHAGLGSGTPVDCEWGGGRGTGSCASRTSCLTKSKHFDPYQVKTFRRYLIIHFGYVRGGLLGWAFPHRARGRPIYRGPAVSCASGGTHTSSHVVIRMDIPKLPESIVFYIFQFLGSKSLKQVSALSVGVRKSLLHYEQLTNAKALVCGTDAFLNRCPL
jgi:hypothetical protein